MDTPTKICKTCEIEKSIKEFSPNRRMILGVTSVCKKCFTAVLRRNRLLARPLPTYQTHKLCIKCKKCQTVSEFGSVTVKRLNSVCKSCVIIYAAANINQIKKNRKRYYKDNKSKVIERASLRYKSPATASSYLNKILPVDEPTDVKGLLYIKCKQCGKSFNPTSGQAMNRVLANKTADGREGNFYCSERCKESCDIFDRVILRKSEVPKAKKDRLCQTNHLKQLQCDEKGYTYCEKCGDIIDVELHHTQRVGTKEAVNSSGHLLLCVGCHTDLHRQC